MTGRAGLSKGGKNLKPRYTENLMGQLKPPMTGRSIQKLKERTPVGADQPPKPQMGGFLERIDV